MQTRIEIASHAALFSKLSWLARRLAYLLLAIGSVSVWPVLAAPFGELDPAFGDHGRVLLRDAPFFEVLGVEVFPDPVTGKLLVVADGYGSDRLLRLNSDGSLDSSFGDQGTALLDFGDDDLDIADVKRLPDGALLIAGAMNVYGTPDNVIHGTALLARMHADGTPDLSFGNGGRAVLQLGGPYEAVSSILLQSDGRIVVFGSTNRSGKAERILARFTQNGAPDASFGDVASSNISSIDAAGFEASLTSILQQSDGRFLVCGDARLGGAIENSIKILAMRFLANGTLDLTFGSNGMVLTGTFQDAVNVKTCTQLADGHFIFAGIFGSRALQRAAAWCLTPDGRLDAGFGVRGMTVVNTGMPSAATALVLMADGKLALAGSRWKWIDIYNAQWSDMLVTTLDPTSGEIDLDFGHLGVTAIDFGSGNDPSHAVSASVRQLPDGKLLVIGSQAEIYDWYYSYSIALTRIDPYGAGSNGWVSIDEGSVQVQAQSGQATLHLRRTGGSTGTLTVDYHTSDGTAVAGTDYVASGGTVSWQDGDMSDKSISFSLLNDAAGSSPTNFAKYFNVQISSASGGLGMDYAIVSVLHTASPNSAPPAGSSGSGAGSGGPGGGGVMGIELLCLVMLCLAGNRACLSRRQNSATFTLGRHR